VIEDSLGGVLKAGSAGVGLRGEISEVRVSEPIFASIVIPLSG
jgi:hypothetical protein